MKNQKLMAIVSGVVLCMLMVASDEHGYTTEKAVVECKGEVFEKSFTPSWGRSSLKKYDHLHCIGSYCMFGFLVQIKNKS